MIQCIIREDVEGNECLGMKEEWGGYVLVMRGGFDLKGFVCVMRH